MEGAKHKKKMNSPTPTTLACEICQITCTDGTALQAHLDGEKHKRKSEKAGSEEANPESLTCDVCEITCNHADALQLHLQGKNSMGFKSKVESKPFSARFLIAFVFLRSFFQFLANF